ncbi:unnamed protein product [Discosporangium mesarthrocarpum]
MKYFQVFMDEASRDKRIYGLKTKDAATSATKAYLDTMARDGVNVKCISGDDAGEFREISPISTTTNGAQSPMASVTIKNAAEQRHRRTGNVTTYAHGSERGPLVFCKYGRSFQDWRAPT